MSSITFKVLHNDEKEVPLKVLTKWKDGDFREVDKDQNKVLKLQGEMLDMHMVF